MSKYDAFISYRHSDLDMWAAKSIHKGLETYKVPNAVKKKTGKAKIQRVFRDQEELPIGSDLNNNISDALANSEYLLVICSPRTPESYWVCKEIDTFISMHGRERILAVLIEGEPEESFPPQLLTDENNNPVEPLAADIRGVDAKERKKKLKTELLRLAAPVLGCTYDDLRQRHRERRIRKIATIICSSTLVISALSIGFGIYNANMVKKIKAQNEKIEAQNVEIKENYKGKQENQSRYLADTSLSLFENGDRVTAALVAVEALSGEDRPYVPEVEYALSKALYAYDTGNTLGVDRMLKHEMITSKMYFSNDGKYLITMDHGFTTYVWEVATGVLIYKENARFSDNGYRNSVKEVGYYNDNLIILEEHSARSISFDGKVNWEVKLDNIYNYGNVVEDAGYLFATAVENVAIINLNDGSVIKTIDNIYDDTTFTGEVAYRKDFDFMAVGRYETDAKEAKISIIDLNTYEEEVYTLPLNFVSGLYITQQGNVAVALTDLHLFDGENTEKAKAGVALIDNDNKEISWFEEDEVYLADDNSTSAILKAVKLDNGLGRIVSARDNHIKIYDEVTGEKIAESYFNGGIESLFLATSGDFGYAAENNGNIDIISLETGKNYTNATITTNKYIRRIAINNGVIAVQERNSPNITLFAYHEGAGLNIFATEDDRVNNLTGSKDGTYIAVEDYNDLVKIYEASTGKEILSESHVYEGASVYNGFIGDDRYVFVDSRGKIDIISLSNKSREKIDFELDMIAIESCYITDNHNYAVLSDSSKVWVVDFETGTYIDISDIKERISRVVLTEDGKKVYISLTEGGLLEYDVEGKTTREINDNIKSIVAYGAGTITLATSKNGKHVAVACQDGVARIIDTQTGEVESEFLYNCQSRSFIKFLEDEDKLICQADDYYIKVYDVLKNEFIYSSTEQFGQISDIKYDDKNGLYAINSSYSLIIMDASKYEIKSEAENGSLLNASNGKIYSKDANVIYEFDYMTLDDLFNEVKNQFGEASLSNEEKKIYYISNGE